MVNPKKSRLVGLDYGRVRVGVSISDETHLIAQPVACLQNGKQFPTLLTKALQPYSTIEAIVLGLPLQMNGKEGLMAKEVRTFAELLQKTLPYPILLWDERLTSTQVDRTLKEAEFSRKERAKMVDTLCAVLILQSYLDTKRYKVD